MCVRAQDVKPSQSEGVSSKILVAFGMGQKVIDDVTPEN